MGAGYYVSRQRKLLKEFDDAMERVRDLVVSRYGEATDDMLREARQDYEALIPELPYVGGKQPFTRFLISTAWYLSLYRALKRRGGSVEEAGQLIYEVTEAYMQAYPRLLRSVLGSAMFSGRTLRRLQRGAQRSHLRRYPGNYVFDFVPGDGTTFDYGVDYLECGPLKFLRERGAPELAPYICPADIISSRLLGWGLKRTMTLAEGADRCDFRFRRAGETEVAVPEPLARYLSGRGT